MSSISRISSDIDFDKTGKQVSYLAVPESSNESAYGTVTIPIAVINNGAGPTLLLTGGVHGVENEAPVALINTLRDLEAEAVQGRLIIIPSLNLPAAMAGLRCSPIDGLNLNRVFPGKRDGTITEMIAHYVCEVILPMVDVVFDIHSGGTTLEYIPEVSMYLCEDPKRQQKSFELVKAFGAPICMVDQVLDETGQFSSVANERGIVNITAEMGGAGRVDPTHVAITHNGVRNVMIHLGMIEGEIMSAVDQGRSGTRYAEIIDLDGYVMCPEPGLYEPFVSLGDEITAGDSIGQIHFVDNLDKAACPVYASRSGFLLCNRPPGRVARGDNIAIVAQDLDFAKYGLG